MSEVLIVYDQPILGPNNQTYFAQVSGRLAEDGLWEGWVEFQSSDGETSVRTPRETQQPNRTDLKYWANGLTEAYLQGALDRALKDDRVVPVPVEVAAIPAFEQPAQEARVAVPIPAQPILDPFEVYMQGEDVLRDQLLALSPDHLKNVIKGYNLEVPEHGSHELLVESIITRVRKAEHNRQNDEDSY